MLDKNIFFYSVNCFARLPIVLLPFSIIYPSMKRIRKHISIDNKMIQSNQREIKYIHIFLYFGKFCFVFYAITASSSVNVWFNKSSLCFKQNGIIDKKNKIHIAEHNASTFFEVSYKIKLLSNRIKRKRDILLITLALALALVSMKDGLF